MGWAQGEQKLFVHDMRVGGLNLYLKPCNVWKWAWFEVIKKSSLVVGRSLTTKKKCTSIYGTGVGSFFLDGITSW